MKRKIYTNMLLLSLTCIMATAAFLTFIFYEFFSGQTEQDVKNETELLAKSLSYVQNGTAYLETLNFTQQMTRATLVAGNGNVLFDSYTDAASLQNHLDRPEILDALNTGAGTGKRLSETLREKTYYHAIRLDNGNVIRLAKTTDSVFHVFLNILPATSLIVLLMAVLCHFLTLKLSRHVLEPINEISLDSDIHQILETYEELAPFLHKIASQKEQIDQHIQSLKNSAATIQTITEDMKEGLILVDAGQMILSANHSAIRLLGAAPESYAHKNILELTRNMDIIQKTKLALNGQTAETMLELDSKTLQVFFNPIFHENQISGAIILFLDITEKANAEKMRRQFSANVSHELKTPLTIILGLSEMMVSGMAKNADIVSFAQKIHNEVKRLIALIENIIQLSELDEGLNEKSTEIFELLHLAASVAEGLKPILQEKNIQLDILGEPFEIRANKVMIMELIQNLMDNSIKYNKPGGRITVHISQEPPFSKIQISDTGIGISKAHLSHIFERFYRVDLSRSKKTGGSGLGLSIVKHIAQYHNGRVEIESEEGKGTSISVYLIQQKTPVSASGETTAG